MSNPDHPGHEAKCFLKITVRARLDNRGGYACGATGGHCLPLDRKCEAFRQEAILDQQRIEEILREERAA